MKKGRELKPHIGIYGRRNNGKSSFINCLAGQDIAIVSNVAGTTTDPVKKSYEITGFGPVVLVDTAGIDDVGELGGKRIVKTLASIKLIDLGILVIVNNTFDYYEKMLIKEFEKYDTPYLIIHNKSDLVELATKFKLKIEDNYKTRVIQFSTIKKDNFEAFIDVLKKTIPESAYKQPSLTGDLVSYGDIVLLITPIDIEAPAGRLILPQIQTIRDLLDNDCTAIIVKEREVDAFLKKTKIRPDLVITDSSIFLKADASIPKDIPMTGFSVILAKLKGDFDNYLIGTPKISELKDGDKILLLESCSHHISCDDIGRVKIPRWISNYSGKKLHYDVVSGLDKMKNDLSEYALVIQCGGCMITSKQLKNRLKDAVNNNISVTNYGMAIAYVQGIYNRAIKPFVELNNQEIDYL